MTEAFRQIRRFQPPQWDQIPDLGLYMDQVITYIGQIFEPLYGREMKHILTPSMINNYVKLKLIPRPAGKKYSREQLALLIVIVALKQVCSMEDIRKLFALENTQTAESQYNIFCNRLTRMIQSLEYSAEGELSVAADYAIRAAACRIGCDAALKESQM